MSNAIEQLNTTVQQATTAMDEGVSGVRKGLITKKLKEVQTAVFNSAVSGDSEQYYQNIAFTELDMLIGKHKAPRTIEVFYKLIDKPLKDKQNALA